MTIVCAAAASLATAGIALAGDALRPDVIRWGATTAELETALAGKCAKGFVTRPIDPPFLPTGPAKQVQIDCDGLDFLGAPRWTEFVIGDDRLQMVWVMVDAADKEKTIKALKDAYGAPSHETPMFIAFTQGRAAWREEPAEVLFYGEELDAPMRGWFDNPQ
ncbi:MAG: hypothetical protein R3C58_10570 [Parvularculaceae bacterium]